jgi:outer membrane protein assembly factor BamD
MPFSAKNFNPMTTYPRNLNLFRFIVVLVATMSINACSIFDDDEDPTAKWSAKEFYDTAKEALKSGNMETAIKYFEMLEARYPYGEYTRQAQLDIADAYLKYEEFDQAISAADRFIRMHPRHERVDEAIFIKGKAAQNKSMGFLDGYFSDPSQRESSSLRVAHSYFKELLVNYSESAYAEDARQRMIEIRNLLAKHELRVALFYRERGANIAVVNRVKYILENYPRTPVIPEALEVMAMAYDELKLTQLAEDTRIILQANKLAEPTELILEE